MAVVMVLKPIAEGDIRSMHELVERCCRQLMGNPGWRSLRVELRSGVGYDQARDAIETARVHGLRCWVTKREIVLEVPDTSKPVRIDHRDGQRPQRMQRLDDEMPKSR